MSKRRRWFRLSLKSALLMTTCVCLWLGWQTHHLRQQQTALAQLQSLGGHPQATTEPSPKGWLWTQPGDFISAERVYRVGFLGPKVSDQEIDAIVHHANLLPGLEQITLTDTAVTRVGEMKLRQSLPQLEIKVIVTAMRRQTPQLRY